MAYLLESVSWTRGIRRLGLLTLLCMCSCTTQEPPIDSDRLLSLLEAGMEEFQVVGASMAVIKDGEVIRTYNLGYADKENQIPVGSKTLFQAASISKPVTALATVALFNRQGLSLDTDVNELLQSWKLPKGEFEEGNVTIRQALSHISGITGFRYRGYPRGASLPSQEQYLRGLPPSNTPEIIVTRAPGTAFEYCPAGYTVVQMILQDLTGQPFHQVMQKEVLERVPMPLSTFKQPLPGSRLNEIAFPYDGKKNLITGGPYTFLASASGGLWTTASELATWLLQARQESEEVFAGSEVNPHWGIGFQVGLDRKGQEVEDGRYISHGGWNTGYLCRAIVHRDTGDGMVILTNSAPDMSSSENVMQWAFIEKSTDWTGQAFSWPDM